MNKKFYEYAGMALLSLPLTQNDRKNSRRRNISDLGLITASRLLAETSIGVNAPLIFCGSQNKAFPVLRQLTKASDLPFLLIGTQRDFASSCLMDLDIEWKIDGPQSVIQEGNGLMTVSTDVETTLELKEYIYGWNKHLIVLCLGNGLCVDSELLNALNSLGKYILLTDAPSRSVKNSGDNSLSVEELLSSMDYILVSSIGTSAKALISVLPAFESEKVTNTTDFSVHKDSPAMFESGHHHRNGNGFRLSQSRMLETRGILTEDDITTLQAQQKLIIYNSKIRMTWIAQIAR